MEKPKKKNISLPPITSPGGRMSIRVTKVAPDPPVKPSGPSFIDRNLRAGKFVLKEGVREAIVESIKGLLGLKSQPV